jgi:hypothetical protein
MKKNISFDFAPLKLEKGFHLNLFYSTWHESVWQHVVSCVSCVYSTSILLLPSARLPYSSQPSSNRRSNRTNWFLGPCVSPFFPPSPLVNNCCIGTTAWLKTHTHVPVLPTHRIPYSMTSHRWYSSCSFKPGRMQMLGNYDVTIRLYFHRWGGLPLVSLFVLCLPPSFFLLCLYNSTSPFVAVGITTYCNLAWLSLSVMFISEIRNQKCKPSLLLSLQKCWCWKVRTVCTDGSDQGQRRKNIRGGYNNYCQNYTLRIGYVQIILEYTVIWTCIK